MSDDNLTLISKKESLKSFFRETACCKVKKQEICDSYILQLISRKFMYGFRLDSVIDMMKLRKYANEEGIKLIEEDDTIRTFIQANGMLMEGKVFIKSKDSRNELFSLVEEIFAKVNSIIYYESLMERHSILMDKIHISSIQLLRETLSGENPNYMFSKNYFSNHYKTTEEVAVSREILRVWDDDVLKSVHKISELLYYIPEEKVRYYLAENSNFVWVSEGTYTCIHKLIMTEAEASRLYNTVKQEIDRKGFISLSDFSLGDALEENHELPELAVRKMVYNKYLSSGFSLNGKIIARGKDEFDAVSIMKQICVKKDDYTLDEAMEDVGNLMGVNNRRIVYLALYDVMIRVDKQKFVADKYVHFDVEAIDSVISSCVDRFSAIKEVTTFALFPICGQPWTHYLLESYCYRYSKKYSYRMNLYNGRNVGAVVESSIDWNYNEILAQVVASSRIKLEPDVIGQYLYETGYMARRKFNSLLDISERAKEIREESV